MAKSLEQLDEQEINKQIQSTILEIAKDPKNTENYHTLANLYGLQSKFDNMISAYESLLQFDSQDVLALVNIGSLWFYKKDYRKDNK